MRCPDEIAEVLLPLIKFGLLRVRAAGWEGKPDLCALESDHIHNLPDLIADYSPEKLAYYWNVERASYVSQLGSRASVEWEPLWNPLGEHVAPLLSMVSHH